MGKTSIEWTDATWNPIRGCSRVSAGCEHCYAERQAHRFSGKGQPYEGLTRLTKHGPVWTGKVTLVPELAYLPLHWKKPKRIFVNSMSDLFHDQIMDEEIIPLLAVMAMAQQHQFQILTKRPARMQSLMSRESSDVLESFQCLRIDSEQNALLDGQQRRIPPHYSTQKWPGWPLPNVWLGVSCEDQATADERIPLLLQTTAAVRFVSLEPLLGPIALRRFFPNPYERVPGGYRGSFPEKMVKLSWVIVGGESGPVARPFNVQWARDIVAQCKAAGVPCFVKQLGSVPVMDEDDWALNPRNLLSARNRHAAPAGSGLVPLHFDNSKGGDWTEWPEDLRVREFPKI